MMTARDDIKTTTYEYGNGFLVDVVEHSANNHFEAWLSHEKYGVKTLMFGMDGALTDEALQIIEANVDEHIELYIEANF